MLAVRASLHKLYATFLFLACTVVLGLYMCVLHLVWRVASGLIMMFHVEDSSPSRIFARRLMLACLGVMHLVFRVVYVIVRACGLS